MGSLLRSVSGGPLGRTARCDGGWGRRIPPLLSRIACGDEDTARIAVDDLGDAICVGFVVGKVTAPTVPFLLELTGSPQVACKADLLDLLGSIYRTDQRHSAAAPTRDRGHDTS